MNNAVIYARYSSAGQNEQSIDGQLRICKEFAESKGFNVVKTYTDKAKSAWSDSEKRIEFQKMLEDARTKTYQTIIVYKFDRFARNRLDSQMYKQRLRKDFGVRVVSATEPVSDDEGGEIYEMFLEWNDEKYSQRLSKRVRDGIDTAILNGTFCGGAIIYGYKIRKEQIGNKDKYIKYVEIDPEPAEIIRFVFTEYARGVSKDEIARKLNAQGKRYKDKAFIGKTFDKWLNNEKYTGEFSYGGRVCTNTYPQIIDKETFAKVQARIQKNRYFTKLNTIREPYLLSGKLFCGHCQEQMTADGGVNRVGNTYKYYICKPARNGKCEKKREDKNTLEQFVTDETIQFFKDPKQLNKAIEDTIAYHEKRTGETEIKSLESRIALTKKDIEDTTTAYIQAVTKQNSLFVEACEKRMSELKFLIDDLETQKVKLIRERGLLVTRERIIACISSYTDGDPRNKEFQKRLIDNLVNTVYLTNAPETEDGTGGAIIFWNVMGTGKQVILPKETIAETLAQNEHQDKEFLIEPQPHTLCGNKKSSVCSTTDDTGRE